MGSADVAHHSLIAVCLPGFNLPRQLWSAHNRLILGRPEAVVHTTSSNGEKPLIYRAAVAQCSSVPQLPIIMVYVCTLMVSLATGLARTAYVRLGQGQFLFLTTSADNQILKDLETMVGL